MGRLLFILLTFSTNLLICSKWNISGLLFLVCLFALVKWWMDTGMKVETQEMENYWIRIYYYLWSNWNI